MTGLLYIALGGAIGALARYGLAGWVQARAGFFPWGTLAVNVAGCLALGFAIRFFEATPLSTELRQAVTIGLLGAFTTFSTFSYEAVALLQDGDWPRASAYMAASVVLGLAGVLAGLVLANLYLHARS